MNIHICTYQLRRLDTPFFDPSIPSSSNILLQHSLSMYFGCLDSYTSLKV
ncbi:hypothetical protein Hanom_Chr02g00178271 [Helianthus anomalus]